MSFTGAQPASQSRAESRGSRGSTLSHRMGEGRGEGSLLALQPLALLSTLDLRPATALQTIQRTLHPKPGLHHHVRVYLCCFHVPMTQQLLDGPDIIVRLQQVSRKGVPQHVRSHAFVQVGFPSCDLNGDLKGAIQHMMSSLASTPRIQTQLLVRPYPIPLPFFTCLLV